MTAVARKVRHEATKTSFHLSPRGYYDACGFVNTIARSSQGPRPPVEPFNWNVVIVGAWNVAILTPDGIRRRLFELADDQPIEVEMAIDRPGAFRVGHEGIVVSPTNRALEIAGRECTLPLLKRAAAIGALAVKVLPETPMTAVGVNIRYRAEGLPSPLPDLLEAKIDDLISDKGLRILARSVRRSMDFDVGFINLEVGESREGIGQVAFNFHRESADSAVLSDWLGRIGEFHEKAHDLLGALGCHVDQRGE